MDFQLVSDYSPAGDQPTAIRELTTGLANGEKDQVLLGVTGSGTPTHDQVQSWMGHPAWTDNWQTVGRLNAPDMLDTLESGATHAPFSHSSYSLLHFDTLRMWLIFDPCLF